MRKQIALIPNANNPLAKAIARRTRCGICKKPIHTGEEIYVPQVGKESVHCACYKKAKKAR